MPYFHDFIAPQTADDECRFTAATIQEPETSFIYEENVVSVAVAPVDGDSKRFIFAAVLSRAFCLYHHLLLAGHPGEQEIYNSIRRELYWSDLANYAQKSKWPPVVHKKPPYNQEATQTAFAPAIKATSGCRYWHYEPLAEGSSRQPIHLGGDR